MKIRIGHLHIFIGFFIIATVFIYGVVVSELAAKVNAILFAALIIIVGFLSVRTEQLEEQIKQIETTQIKQHNQEVR